MSAEPPITLQAARSVIPSRHGYKSQRTRPSGRVLVVILETLFHEFPAQDGERYALAPLNEPLHRHSDRHLQCFASPVGLSSASPQFEISSSNSRPGRDSTALNSTHSRFPILANRHLLEPALHLMSPNQLNLNHANAEGLMINAHVDSSTSRWALKRLLC